MINLNLAVYLPFNYDPTNPSIRLRRLNLPIVLKKLGVRCELIQDFGALTTFNNILVCHADQVVIEQIKLLKQAGKRIFVDHSEALFYLENQHDVFSLADVIVCCSTVLAKMTKENYPSSQVVVIPDMYEDETLYAHS